MKIAIAYPLFPDSLADSLHQVEVHVKQAAKTGADIICFPESYIPGYPIHHEKRIVCSADQLEESLKKVCELAAQNNIAVILPMDWYKDEKLLNVAQVISKTGEVLGYQTKNQLDPSEESLWKPGTERHIFEVDGVKFGITICHEGFRYPESVRWAAMNGASIVFHPNYTGSEKEIKIITEWGAKDSPYYEKAQMMRAMENTIYFAPSNYYSTYPESASAVIDPEGNCIAYHDYGKPGVVITQIDPAKGTGFLAKRFKKELYTS